MTDERAYVHVPHDLPGYREATALIASLVEQWPGDPNHRWAGAYLEAVTVAYDREGPASATLAACCYYLAEWCARVCRSDELAPRLAVLVVERARYGDMSGDTRSSLANLAPCVNQLETVAFDAKRRWMVELLLRSAAVLERHLGDYRGNAYLNLANWMAWRERYVEAALWFNEAVRLVPSDITRQDRALHGRWRALEDADMQREAAFARAVADQARGSTDLQGRLQLQTLPQQSLTARLWKLRNGDASRRTGVSACLLAREADVSALEAQFDASRFAALLDALPEDLAELSNPGSLAELVAAGRAACAPLAVEPEPVTMPYALLELTAMRKAALLREHLVRSPSIVLIESLNALEALSVSRSAVVEREARVALARIQAHATAFPEGDLWVQACLQADWWYLDWCHVGEPGPAAPPNGVVVGLEAVDVDTLFDSVARWPSLNPIALDLGANGLSTEELSEAPFAALTNLKALRLGGNELDVLPKGISGLPHLVLLDVRHNPGLVIAPDALRCPALQVVEVGGTAFDDVSVGELQQVIKPARVLWFGAAP